MVRIRLKKLSGTVNDRRIDLYIHWVLMMMDLRQDERVVLYFDPVGHGIRRDILCLLSLIYSDLNIQTYRQKVQYDGCQCGVWICWVLSLVLERVNKMRLAQSLF